MSGRGSYTSKEDAHLVQYIAKALPGPAGRAGNKIYRDLVEDPSKWPWAKAHSWQGWRERYMKHRAEFDQRIGRLQILNGKHPDEVEADLEGQSSQRNPFTDAEDKLLMKYIARYNPAVRGRNGNEVYKQLVENVEGKWNWSRAHSWHSWRNRYVSHQDHFDREIRKYQQRHGIEPPPQGAPLFRPERPRKRQKFTEADSQEEQWARINWVSPAKGGVPKANGPDTSEDKKVVVVKTERNETTAVQSQSNIDGDANEDSSENDEKPPDSEDYQGEIFPSSEKDEDMESGDRQVSGDEDANDQVAKRAEEGQYNEANGSENRHSEVVIKNESEARLLNLQSNLGGHIKVERASPQCLPHAQPSPKPTANGHQHDIPHPSQPRRRKPSLSDDPFEDSDPSPQNSRQIPVKKKRTPNFIEGAFVSSLNGMRSKKTQGSSTEESDDELVWPPLRLKRAARSQAEDGTVKTSDKDAAAVGKPREQNDKGKVRGDGQSAADISKAVPFKPLKKTHRTSAANPGQRRQQPTRRPQETNVIQAQATPEAGPSRVTTVKTDVFAQSPGVIPKRYSTGDIVDSTPISGRIVDQTYSTGSRTIDLRQELANRQLQLVHRPPARPSRASSTISEEDHQFIQQLGIQQAARMLSKEFGFTEAVVQRLWKESQSFRLVKVALAEMKSAADQAMNEWVETSLVVSGKNASDTPSTITSAISIVKSGLPRVTNSASKIRASSVSLSVSGGGGGRKSLDIRPVDRRDTAELDYEPLIGTRAGKYARLVKMGRKDEALKREQRRVSSIALSPRRDGLQQPLQQQWEGDPSPKKGRTEEEREGMQDESHDENDANEGSGGDGVDRLDEGSEDGMKGEEQEGDHKDGQHEREDRAMQVDSPKSPQVEPDEGDEVDGRSETEQSREVEPTAESTPERPSGKTDKIDNDDDNDQLLGHDTRNGDGDGGGDVSTTSESSDVIEVEAMVQSEKERWKEVDQLFWAANRHNVEMLRELEKSFNPEFLMDWLSTKVVLK